MEVIEPNSTPLEALDKIDVFLAGGISKCPDWQSRALELLSTTDLHVANPRRFDHIDFTGAIAKEQITWEYNALAKSKVILFWFPKESLCPIALYELGVQVGLNEKPIMVGADLKYARRFDLQTQLELANTRDTRFSSTISTSLEATLDRVRKYFLKV